MKIIIYTVFIWCFIWGICGDSFFKRRFGEIIKRDLYDDIKWTTYILLWMTIFTCCIIINKGYY